MNEELEQELNQGFADLEIQEQKEFLCTGSLLRGLSYIERRSVEKKLSNEKELRIYIARETLIGSQIQRLQEETGLALVSKGYALFEGEIANMHTSYLQQLTCDKKNSLLYLITLNSCYVFKVHEWAEQSMGSRSLSERHVTADDECKGVQYK